MNIYIIIFLFSFFHVKSTLPVTDGMHAFCWLLCCKKNQVCYWTADYQLEKQKGVFPKQVKCKSHHLACFRLKYLYAFKSHYT